MNNQIKTVVLVAILVIAIGGYLFPKGNTVADRVVEKVQLGASPGPDHYDRQFFKGGLNDGSDIFSTSTTGTLTAKILETNKGIYIAATGAGQGTLSITLPATTTMSSFLNDKGTCASWWIDAADVAAGTTTTIVAGTGWNLVGLDATGAGTGADVIDGAEYATLTACREFSGDITGFIHEYIHAD